MLNKLLALSLLTISISAESKILDLGDFTRDTTTRLDWLDLTLTVGRSYNDIITSLNSGGEFHGWRYASRWERNGLWDNLIEFNGTSRGAIDKGTAQYEKFPHAFDLLGDTMTNSDSDYYKNKGGVMGIVEDYDINSPGYLPDSRIAYGYNNYSPTRIMSITKPMNFDESSSYIGSYLVRVSPIPVPAAAWLFGSALIGLLGFKRKK